MNFENYDYDQTISEIQSNMYHSFQSRNNKRFVSKSILKNAKYYKSKMDRLVRI